MSNTVKIFDLVGTSTTINGQGGALTMAGTNGNEVSNVGPAFTINNKRSLTKYTVNPATAATGNPAEYQTIQAAIDAVLADTAGNAPIIVYPGTYTENLVFKSTGLTIQPYTVVDGSTTGDVVIDGNHTFAAGVASVHLRNLNFSGNSASPLITATEVAQTINCRFCTFYNQGAGGDILADTGVLDLAYCTSFSSITMQDTLSLNAPSGVFSNCILFNVSLDDGAIATFNFSTLSGLFMVAAEAAILNYSTVGSNVAVPTGCFLTAIHSFSGSITGDGTISLTAHGYNLSTNRTDPTATVAGGFMASILSTGTLQNSFRRYTASTAALVSMMLEGVRSTGTPAQGFGLTKQWVAQDDANAERVVGEDSYYCQDPNAAAPYYYYIKSLLINNVLAEQYRFTEYGMLPSTGTGVNYVQPGAYPYTALPADEMISVDSSVIRTINLPNAPPAKKRYIVKDRTGNAFTNNITVTTPGGVVTIDGAATYLININYESATFVFNGTSYEVI